MSLQRWRERYVLFVMWKIHHGLVTNDLGITWDFNSRRGLRANVRALPCNVAKVNTIHDKSFKVIGPRLWNTLPKAINTQDTLSGFKSSLDTYLLNIQDCPPVAGYSRANDNSLLSRIQWFILFIMIYHMLFHICYLWSTICRQGGLISNQLTRFSL